MTRGFLTKKLEAIWADLPYNDYQPEIYRAVLMAIRAAWHRLLSAEGDALSNWSEIEITTSLQVILEDLRCATTSAVGGFTSQVFETVARDGAIMSHDGQHLEKKPDFTFRLIDLRPGRSTLHRGIFVECKIMSLESHHVRLYCFNGIGRYVRGEYAWAMKTGILVAYVRDACTMEGTLIPFLEAAQNQNDPYYTHELPSPSFDQDSPAGPVHTSRHGRPYSRQGRPGDIMLHHLWLGRG